MSSNGIHARAQTGSNSGTTKPAFPVRRGTLPVRTSTRTTSDRDPMHDILFGMLAFRDGDFSYRLPAEWTGILGKIADAFNDVVAISDRRMRQRQRVCQAVGKEGKLRQRVTVPGAAGAWADDIQAFNTLVDDLVWPTKEVARTIGAVAKGDLDQSMALEVDGRPLEASSFARRNWSTE